MVGIKKGTVVVIFKYSILGITLFYLNYYILFNLLKFKFVLKAENMHQSYPQWSTTALSLCDLDAKAPTSFSLQPVGFRVHQWKHRRKKLSLLLIDTYSTQMGIFFFFSSFKDKASMVSIL